MNIRQKGFPPTKLRASKPNQTKSLAKAKRPKSRKYLQRGSKTEIGDRYNKQRKNGEKNTDEC